MKRLISGGAGGEWGRLRVLLGLGLVFAGWGTIACSEGGAVKNADPAVPKYYEDVAPIINHNCVGCHRPGGIAEFALTSYDEVRDHASAIVSATAERRMPPMPVDNSGKCNTYSNARWLSDDEIRLLGRWATAGTPAGDASKAPALPGALPSLENPDAVLDMGVSYTPNDASGHDDYRCFVVPSPVDALRYLTRYQVLPGQEREVHHLIVYQPANDAEATAAHALDDAAAGAGYPCFGGPGVDASPFAMWAPGAGAIDLPAGTGVPLVAHRDLVIQIHYNLENGMAPDRTRVALAFAKDKPISAQFAPISNSDLRLPPGLAKVESTANSPVSPVNFTVYGAMPHMHTLGRTMRVEIEANGASQCLVDVDRWNFHWQNAWWYSDPLLIDKPSSISIRCGFDTREKSSVVTWGESTNDEMCISYLYITASPAQCDDQANPLFGSCLEDFLAGCYEPDLSGTCTTDDGSVTWSDGSKIVRSGAAAGLYRAGSDQPCVTATLSSNGALLSKGDQQLSYKATSDQVTVDCPDGSQVHASGQQLNAFNRCHGVNCPN
ncbi:MAG TPA: hypothetical protein VJV79_04705 [Polyangiaceae bacterium]|nr:hypothetical protein [Polyangiaceae bacterium]